MPRQRDEVCWYVVVVVAAADVVVLKRAVIGEVKIEPNQTLKQNGGIGEGRGGKKTVDGNFGRLVTSRRGRVLPGRELQAFC